MAGMISLIIESWFRKTVPTQLAHFYFYDRDLVSREVTLDRNLCYNTNVIIVVANWVVCVLPMMANFINWRTCR